MASCTYQAPTSLSALSAALSEAQAQGERSRILAGGTDLLVQMQAAGAEWAEAGRLVDIKKIPETSEVRIDDEAVYIGAAVPAADLTAHAALGKIFPGLIEAVGYIGSSQIQSRATIGGNLANASPAGDTIPALIVNGARCVIHGGQGSREVLAKDFATGVRQNCLATSECLLGLLFKRPAPRTADAYIRFTPRTEMDIAVVGTGVSLTLDARGICTAATIGIGAVAPTVLCLDEVAALLVGTTLEDAALAAAGEAAAQASSPITDKRGSAEFRCALVKVLVKRTAQMAYQRAKQL